MKAKLLLVFILIWMGTTGIFRIDKLPGGLSVDEVSFSYNAFTIWKERVDQFGVKTPLYFESFGEYKNPVPVYFLVPFFHILGPHVFSVRLPGVLLSVLGVWAIYLFTHSLLKRSRIALLASFFLSISPWYFFFSRFWGGYMPGFVFFILGLYFFISASKHPYKFILSALSFLISYYSYHSTKTTIIGILPFLFALSPYAKWKLASHKKSLALAIAIVIIGILPSVILIHQTLARASMVSITKNPEMMEIMTNFIHDFPFNDSMPLILVRFLVNKPSFYIRSFLEQFAYHFSFEFLFFQGDRDLLFHFPNEGVLYLWQSVFLIWGGVLLVRKRNYKSILILFLCIITILPSALSASLLSISSRGFLFLFPLILLIAYGTYDILKKLSLTNFYKRVTYLILTTVCIFSTFHLLVNYFFHFPRESAVLWKDGDRIAATYVFEKKDNYRTIVVDSSLLSVEHILFFNQIPASQFLKSKYIRKSDPYGFKHITNYKNMIFPDTFPYKEEEIPVNLFWIGTSRHIPRFPCFTVHTIGNTSDKGVTIATAEYTYNRVLKKCDPNTVY